MSGVARDAILRDGLESAWSGKHMAQEATEVAAELEITRAAVALFNGEEPVAPKGGARLPRA